MRQMWARSNKPQKEKAAKARAQKGQQGLTRLRQHSRQQWLAALLMCPCHRQRRGKCH